MGWCRVSNRRTALSWGASRPLRRRRLSLNKLATVSGKLTDLDGKTRNCRSHKTERKAGDLTVRRSYMMCVTTKAPLNTFTSVATQHRNLVLVGTVVVGEANDETSMILDLAARLDAMMGIKS